MSQPPSSLPQACPAIPVLQASSLLQIPFHSKSLDCLHRITPWLRTFCDSFLPTEQKPAFSAWPLKSFQCCPLRSCTVIFCVSDMLSSPRMSRSPPPGSRSSISPYKLSSRCYHMLLALTKKIMDSIFERSFRFGTKLREKYRVPTYPFHSTQPSPLPASCTRRYLCYHLWAITDTSLPTRVHSLHQGSLSVVHFMGFDECVMTYIRRYDTEYFHCPTNPPCSTYASLPLPQAAGTFHSSHMSVSVTWFWTPLVCLPSLHSYLQKCRYIDYIFKISIKEQ